MMHGANNRVAIEALFEQVSPGVAGLYAIVVANNPDVRISHLKRGVRYIASKQCDARSISHPNAAMINGVTGRWK